MPKNGFLGSWGGFALLVTIGWVLVSLGILAFVGESATAASLRPVLLLPPMMGCVAAVILSAEAYPSITLAMILGLPVPAGLTVPLMYVMPGLGAGVGGLFAVLGLVAMGLAFVRLPSREGVAAHSAPVHP